MKHSKFRGLFKPRVVFFLGSILFHGTFAGVSQSDYNKVIQSTKGDSKPAQLSSAIDQLRQWHMANPEDLRIVYDLTVLLDRAGDYPGSESYYHQIIQSNAPTFALLAVAHAALKNKHFHEAETAYQLAIAKSRNDINAQVGLVYAWMGQQRIEQAFNYALQHLPKNEKQYSAKNLPMLIALAELFQERRDFVSAASGFQKALELNPESRYARRGLVFSLRDADLPTLANYYADQFPSEFNADEKSELARANAASTIRFGEAQMAFDTTRFRLNTTDIAIEQNTQITDYFGESEKTKFDRIVALKDRGQMLDAVQLYRSLVDANIATPSYVKFAAADAYLFLEQPEIARDLYLQGLKDFGDNDPDTLLDRQISLMYAYNEAEQHQQAEALAEQVLASKSRSIYQGVPSLERANPDYLSAYLMKARLLTDNERFDLAEHHLDALHREAPFNRDIRSAWAVMQVARDHPRAALEEYSLILIDQPNSVEATVGRGETLLSLNEFAEAKKLYRPLPDSYPENKAIQNYGKELQIYGEPFYKIETTFGQGSLSNGSDSLVDAIVYSAPLSISKDHVRLFSHFEYARGETADSVMTSRKRLGIGFDYRARDMDMEMEVNHTLGNPNNNGAALALGWNFSDAWYGQAAIDTNVIDLPAAALVEGITAQEATLNLTWSKNESRKAGGELSTMHFSDSNVRNSARVWWMERWVSTPTFKFDSTLSMATSGNSEINRNYFNPVRDEDLNLALKAEWLTWRRYLRTFRQRVELSVGDYSQRDFGSGATAGIRYEHEWKLDNELGITYGVGRNFQPFDGIREFRNYLYLNISGRIK